MDVKYFYYQFYNLYLQGVYNKLGEGVRSTLGPKDLGNLPILVPPLEEQQKIVNFIQQQDRRTRKLIKNKKKLIELLEEQKIVVIESTVNAGVESAQAEKSPTRKWSTKPLKHWIQRNIDSLSNNTDPDFEFDYIDIGCVGTGKLVSAPERMRFEESPSRARQIVKQGDTLVSTVRTYLKAVYYIKEASSNLIASTGFAVLRPLKNIESELLGYILQSTSFIEAVTKGSVGASYPAITEAKLKRIPISVPVLAEAQRILLNALRENTNEINQIISTATKEIKLIQEYRSRLIADAVTGKIDLRSISLEPTEESPEENLSDISENGFDTDAEIGADEDELLEEAAHAN
jgi:type I restriction enzyme S subunit